MSLAHRALRALSTPLHLDDYLSLVNPMWSSEWRGRIAEVRPETHDMTTIRIRTNDDRPAHRPGQYLRLGIELDGRRHWRAYTVTSDPGDPLVSVTVKEFGGGVVSGHLVRNAQVGDLVHLGDVEGTFTLPDAPPAQVLLLSAGSGITPILGLLRQLDRAGAKDIVHVACFRADRDFAFGTELRALAERVPGYHLLTHASADAGRITPARLAELVPDWLQRMTYACGPGPLLDALEAYWVGGGVSERLSVERFQPLIGQGVETGTGGVAELRIAGASVTCAPDQPILAAAREAGLRLPHGCEIGICRTCVGSLVDGRVRDLRTGELIDEPRTMVRTCVSCPEGTAQLDL